jgi:hypothetical protein
MWSRGHYNRGPATTHSSRSPMTPPEILLGLAGAYLAVGFVFSVPFAFLGAGKIDPDAQDATWGFRVMVIPGATLLWPLMAKRWMTGAPPPEERTPHKCGIRESAISETEGSKA